MNQHSEDIIFLGQDYARELAALEEQCFAFPWSEKEFRLALSRKNFLVLGLIRSRELMGYLSFYHVQDQVEILNLAVHPQARGRGRAGRLLSFLMDYCSREKVSLVFLEVRPSNRSAVSLYQRFGFQRAGRRPGYYPDTGEDALVYQLDLVRKET